MDDAGSSAWALASVTLRAIGTSSVIAGAGVFATRSGYITGAGKRCMAELSMNMLMPALLFTNVIACGKTECSPWGQLIGEAWFLFIFPVVVVSSGLVLGKVVAYVTRCPPTFTKACTGAVAFANSTGMSISLLGVLGPMLMQAKVVQVDPLRYQPIYLVLYPMLQWTIGSYLFGLSDDAHSVQDVPKESQNHMANNVTEKVPIIHAFEITDAKGMLSAPIRPQETLSTNVASPSPVTSFVNSVSFASRYSPVQSFTHTEGGWTDDPNAPTIGAAFRQAERSAQGASFASSATHSLVGPYSWQAEGAPAGQARSAPSSLAPCSLSQSWHARSAVSQGLAGPDEAAGDCAASVSSRPPERAGALPELEAQLPEPRSRGDSMALPSSTPQTRPGCLCICFLAIRKVAAHALVPPVIGAVLGIFVAVIPRLRGLLVPLRGPKQEPMLGFVFEGLTVLGRASVPVNMLMLGSNLAQGADLKAIPIATNLGIIFMKMLGQPFLMAVLIYGLARVVQGNISIYLVMIVMSVTPTANNIMIMVELSGQNKEAMSACIFTQYLFAPVLTTAVITGFLVLLETSWYLA